MNIVCRKTKCKYNNNLACQSKKIFIDRELNCEQFTPIEKDSLQDISKNMMEVAPEIAPFRHNKDISIKCQANCVFNKDCNCTANGIFVNGQTAQSNENVQNIVHNDEKQNNKMQNDENSIKNKNQRNLKHFFNAINKKTKEKYNENQINENNEDNVKDIKSEHTENCNLTNEKTSGQAKCFTFANK